jgi:hypothetical protein
MQKIFTVISLLFISFNNYSQSQSMSGNAGQEFLQDISGRYLTSNNYTDVDGNPYFPKNWIEGTVVLKTGKVINYNALRLNMLSGNLEFYYTDKAYDVINQINEFTLGTMKFRNGFEPTEKQNADSFYQVLYDGKQKLLCHRLGSIYIDAPYNSATKTKKFELHESYYLQKSDGKLHEVKKNLKYFLTVLGDKSSQLEEYCKKENIKLRSWDDAVKVLEYADSLEKQ